MEIKNLMQQIHENNKAKGFWEGGKEGKNVGESLMLCVSELSEALEAHRKGRIQPNYIDLSLESTDDKEFAKAFELNIKDTFPAELADTVIRIFDICEGFGIDLEYHLAKGLRYNKTRPFKHGKSY